MNQQSIEQVRTLARSLAVRAWLEQDFRKLIQENPVETLTGAGLPEEYVDIFLQEAQLSETTGYSMNRQCLLSDSGFLQDFIY